MKIQLGSLNRRPALDYTLTLKSSTSRKRAHLPGSPVLTVSGNVKVKVGNRCGRNYGFVLYTVHLRLHRISTKITVHTHFFSFLWILRVDIGSMKDRWMCIFSRSFGRMQYIFLMKELLKEFVCFWNTFCFQRHLVGRGILFGSVLILLPGHAVRLGPTKRDSICWFIDWSHMILYSKNLRDLLPYSLKNRLTAAWEKKQPRDPRRLRSFTYLKRSWTSNSPMKSLVTVVARQRRSLVSLIVQSHTYSASSFCSYRPLA